MMMRRIAEKAIEDHEADRYRSHISLLTPSMIERFFDELPKEQKLPGDAEELADGCSYLRRLLRQTDPFELERFCDMALESMGDDGRLDLRKFTATQRALFEEMFLKGKSSDVQQESIDRREAMRRIGKAAAWGFVVEAASGATARALNVDHHTRYPDALRQNVQRASIATDYVVTPLALGGIGVHILNDMKVEKVRILLETMSEKLDRIEFAVDELAERTRSLNKQGWSVG